MSDWQPIETAPRDGTHILGFGLTVGDETPSILTVRWGSTYKEWNATPNEATEYDLDKYDLTHWMPLPEPPK